MKLKQLTALLLCLVMAAAVFAGCQPNEPVTSDEPGGDSTAPVSEAPVATEDPNAEKYGGTFIMPIGQDPQTLLYWVPGQNGSRWHTTMNDVLFYLDVDTKEITYRVCESMELNDDETVYTFHIRDNVYWHDGVKLTAEDVVWSHDIWYEEDWFYPCSWSIPGKWEALDELTVQVTLDAPNSALLETIHQYLGLQPKHYYEGVSFDEFFSCEQAFNPIGCGPFKFEEYIVGDYLKFTAFEDFWAGRPYMDEIIMKIGAGSGSEGEINFETGQVDMITIDKSYYREIEDRTDEFNFVINKKPSMCYGLDLLPYMIGGTSFVSDYNFRHAMTYMFDYDTLINSLYYGYAEKQQSMYAPALSIYEPVTNWTYDPAEANRILDESGYIDTDGNGIRNWPEDIGGIGNDVVIQLWYVGAGSDNEYLCIILADAMAECGIAAIPYLINSGTFMDTYLEQWNGGGEDNDTIAQAILDAAQILFPMAQSYGVWPSEWKYMSDPEFILGTQWRNWITEEDYIAAGMVEMGGDFNSDTAWKGYAYHEFGEDIGDDVLRLAELNKLAQAEKDPVKQQDYYRQIQELYCNELIAYIPLAGSWDMIAFNKRVHLEECTYDLRTASLPWDMEKMWLE